MRTVHWGGHPVFASALAAVADQGEQLPEEVEQRLRSGRLTTDALVRVAAVCLDALQSHARGDAAKELQRFARSVERQRREPLKWSLDLPPWARDLSHAEGHLRRVRGVERLAVLGGVVAWCDIHRDGRAAVRFTTELVEGTTAVLARTGASLEPFVCALLEAP